MAKKLLVIGAKGNLGQDLVKLFQANANYEVLGWDMSEIDITDREKVLEKIKEVRPDVVISSAAYNAVDKAEEPEGFAAAMKVNAEGPENLALACKEIGSVFVTYSSDYVFKGDKNDGYKEDATPDPVCKYGESKAEGEKKVQAVGGKYYIVRTSKLFGKPGVGENVKKSFVDMMIELSVKMPELKVVDEEVSCFTYTPDLARTTKELIEGNHEPGIYHIVNGEPCTWYDCVKTIFEILGRDVKVVPVPASEFPRPAKRPNYSVLLNTKMPQLRSYKEALKEYLK